MKLFSLFLFILWATSLYAKAKVIHIVVALCDNTYQGIVPVPSKIGNGQDPATNLYWGCGYGIKSFLPKKDWKLIQSQYIDTLLLERCIFYHSSSNAYIIADAYNGKYIATSIEQFLKYAAFQDSLKISFPKITLEAGGAADLVVYVGHDGLMDFDVPTPERTQWESSKPVMVFACISREYFSPHLKKLNSILVVGSTGLMSAEAYTAEAAIKAWCNNEDNKSIANKAAIAYHTYQKCGLKAAQRLLITGY